MADLQFNEESQYQSYQQGDQKPFFVRLVLATGIVTTDRQAEYVLLGIAVMGIIISLFLFFSGSNKSPLPPKIMDNTFVPLINGIQN